MTSALRGWVYGVLGGTVGVPVFLAAVLAAPPRWAPPLRVTGFTVVLVGAVLLLGVPRSTRARLVGLTNRLLGTDIPAPVPVPGWGWTDRLRTAAWLLVHLVLGTVVAVFTFLALLTAATLPGVWLTRRTEIELFGSSVDIRTGWAGAWTVPVAVGCLLAALLVAVAASVTLRRGAPLLLGHRRAERLALAEQQMRLLARRNRLAQELHDSIGHTLTASTIQAALADELMERDPEAARRAVNAIERISRGAMDDLDHVLGVLREERPDTTPRCSLADLPALTEQVRQAGLELRVAVDGELDRVPPTLSREAYRIVQEGLTNTLRHASPAEADLRVEVTGDWLRVELTNPVDGTFPVAADDRHGHGITGVTERVRLLRGEVSAGPVTPGGTGWRLTARLPLRSAP